MSPLRGCVRVRVFVWLSALGVLLGYVLCVYMRPRVCLYSVLAA